MDLTPHRSRFARYGAAVLFVLGAVTARWVLMPLLHDKGALLFAIPAVLLAAMLGGLGPGLVATLLGAVLTDFFIIPPVNSLSLAESIEFLRIAVFCFVGITVSLLAERGRKAQQALAEQKEALRVSEERLRLATQSARVGIFDWDIRTNQTVWTPQLETIHGLAPGEFKGTYEGWRAYLHPEDASRAEQTVKESMETGTHQAEWRVVWPDGSVHWVESRGWLYHSADGKPARMMGVNIDITARKEAEKALRESEAGFRALMENAPDTVFIANRDGVYLAANPNVTRLLGYSPEEFVGKRITDLIRPEESPRLDRVKTDSRAETSHLAEWDLRHKDGHYVPVELSSRLLPDGRWLAFVRDASERKAAEDALRGSEARFRQMADSAPAMLWLTEPDGHCSFLSRGWYDFTGQTEETGSGLGWTQAIHPEDREAAKSAFLTACERREPYRSEFRARRADGEYRWVLDTGRPRFAEDGTFLGMIGSVIDIHERQKAEDRMRTLATVAENCSEFIGICNLDLQPLYVNEAGRRMVGLDSMDEVRRTSVLDYFLPEDLPMIEREALPVLQAGKAWAGEVRFRHFKTGEAIYTRWNAFVIRDANGKPMAWATVSPNLTAVKVAEASARAAMQSAEAANQAKDQFLAALSHELRTPLNPVLMLAVDQAKNEELPADIREDFSLIRQNVELEVRLIDDLLDLTRITRGKLELRKQSCDIHELLEASREILRADLAEKNLVITMDLSATDHVVDGDPVRLQQVFWNVLRNAVRFTPASGTITVQTRDSEDRHLRIEVSDNGQGIAPEELSQIFSAFEQGSAGHRFGGLGLGLAISRSVLELHGGHILARSEGHGHGATFIVELPAGTPAMFVAPLVNASPAPVTPPSRVLRILLVEDHEATRRTLGRLLERRGYVVVAAENLAVARELNATQSFDLFISDLGLPDGDGCDLMQEFLAAGGPPGIALSGYGMEEDVERSLASGFCVHLTKPVDMEALDRVLDTWPASVGEASTLP